MTTVTVTVKQLAKMAKVHPSTVFIWIRRGLIMPGRRIGRYRVWMPDEAQIILEHVQCALGQAIARDPVRVSTPDGPGWQCPACQLVISHANSPAAARFHMRLCPCVWSDAKPERLLHMLARVAARGVAARERQERQSPRSRQEVIELAIRVVDGKEDPEFFAEVAKIRLAHIRVLETELQRLRGENAL